MMDKKCVGGIVEGDEELKAGRESSLPDWLLKRQEAMLLEKREAARKRTEEEEGEENFCWFMEGFKAKEKGVIEMLQELEGSAEAEVKREETGEALKAIWGDLQTLNKEVFAYVGILRAFDLRTCKEVIKSLEERASRIEAKLLPKKKFGFKSTAVLPVQQKTPSGGGHTKEEEKKSLDSVDSKLVTPCDSLFSNKEGETLRGEASGDVVVSHLTHCTLILEGVANTLTLESLSDCLVVADPVTTSVVVDRAKDSKLLLACQQLRIHDSTSTDFYLHVTTGPIVEDSSCIRLAPAPSTAFPPDALISASLDPATNNWDSANDFNWLSPTVPSPNWSLLPTHLRLDSWPR